MATDEYGFSLDDSNAEIDEYGFPLTSSNIETDEYGFSLASPQTSNPAKKNLFSVVGLASDIKPNDDQVLKSSAYGFSRSLNDLTGIKQMLDARFPEEEPYVKRNIGGKDIWMAKGLGLNFNELAVPEEVALAANKKAKEIADLPTYEERRAKLEEGRVKNVEEKYSDLTEKQKNSPAALTGSIGKALFTPTTLIGGPLWKGPSITKKALQFGGIGALWGAEYSAITQAAETGTIDPKQLAVDTGYGFAGGAGVRIGAPIISKTIGNTYKGIKQLSEKVTPNKTLDKRAKKLIKKAEVETAKLSLENKPASEIPKLVKQNLRISDEEFTNAVARVSAAGGRKINLPNKMSAEQARNTIKKYENTGTPGWVSNLIVPIHQRLKEVAPKLAARLRQFEFDISDETGRYMREIQPFVKQLETGFLNVGGIMGRSITKAEKVKINKYLMNGKYDEVENILKKYKGGSEALNKVRPVLNELFSRAKAVGVKIDFTKNYFPRLPIDSQKLRAAVRDVDLEEGNLLADEIRKAGGKNITPQAEQAIIRKRLNAIINRRDGEGFSNLKSRRIEEVYDEILEFYDAPESALTEYIQNMVGLINKKKFFGNSADSNEIMAIDSNKSIANFLSNKTDGLDTLNQNQLDEIQDLLQARFNGGEQASDATTSLYKNIIYSTHLGNPYNALTQFGDLGVTAYMEGFWNSIGAAFSNKYNLDVRKLGVENWGAELGTSKGFFRSLADMSFKSGFTWVDRFGKNTLINAAFRNVSKQVKTNKGLAKLRKEYGDTFGDDFDNFVEAVKRNDTDDYNVKLYMFNRLSDAQPISLSEMPAAYLNNPHGRFMYTLKSFALKQLNILRNDVLVEAKKPGAAAKLKAGKNLAAYTMLVTGGNTGIQQVKNIILDRADTITPESITGDFANNILRQLFLSRYALDRYKDSGDIVELVSGSVVPPFDIFKDMGVDFWEMLKVVGAIDRTESEMWNDTPHRYKSSRYIPGTGRLGYDYLGGGNQEFREKREKEMWSNE